MGKLKQPVSQIQRGDRLIGGLIGLCWFFVAALGSLSWLEPGWFVVLMEPGRLSEARDLKVQGDLALRQGNLALAAAAYSQALKANPGMQDAKGNLGIVMMKQGRLEEARRIFLEQLEEYPQQVEITAEHLGRISERQGRISEAAVWFERSAAVAAYPAPALCQAGRLRLVDGAASVALPLLQRSLEAETRLDILFSGMLWRQLPLDADSTGRLARIRATGTRPDHLKPYAGWVLDWCASRSRDVARTQHLIALAHAMLGDTASAVATTDLALVSSPTFADRP